VDRWAGNVTGHGSEGGTRLAREHCEDVIGVDGLTLYYFTIFPNCQSGGDEGAVAISVRPRPTPTMRRTRSSDSVARAARLLLLLPKHLCIGNAGLSRMGGRVLLIRRVSRYFHFGTRDTRKSVWLHSIWTLLPLDTRCRAEDEKQEAGNAILLLVLDGNV
jgi:hypothetical protein